LRRFIIRNKKNVHVQNTCDGEYSSQEKGIYFVMQVYENEKSASHLGALQMKLESL